MNSLFRATAILCGLIIILAVGYVQLQQRHLIGGEVAKKAVFTPASGVLVDRARYQIGQDLGANVISTSLPVEVGVQAIPFAQTYQAPKPDPKGKFSDDTDADQGAALVPSKGAYLMKFSNSELCTAGGTCPVVLATQAPDASVVQNALLKINAKNVWVSSHTTNGNPDLIIDYGNGAAPVRMVWTTDGQFPGYDIAPATKAQPLPELK